MLAVAPDRLASIPAAPGAYLLVDGRGRVLYAGRAGVLRSRVRSYWSASLDRPGLRGMVRRVRRILIAPAASEHEAALLERVLLERLDPPFNRTQGIEVLVALRVSTAPPQIAAVVELDRNAPHFGPYLGWAPTLAAASALARMFPLHLCRPGSELGSLELDLARRKGVSIADASRLARSVVDVLDARPDAVDGIVIALERDRDRAADLRLFEQAAEVQRQLVGIRWITQAQRLMHLAPSGDGWVCDEERIAAVLGAVS